MTKDYYSILGVEKGASQDDIKKAYKKLAKQYHPDLNKEASASDKFKEINEAAAVLGDPDKRKQYDQFGTAEGNNFSGFDYRDFAQGFNFDDIFDQFFSGMGFKQNRGRAGRDLAAEVTISLDEVLHGTTRELKLQRFTTCSACDGKGGHSFTTCSTCQGQGMVRQARRTPFGVFASTTTCGTCKGAGERPEKTCEECDGEGRMASREPLKVKIPAGIEDGMKLRLDGEGEAGSLGAPNGDLYVIVSVENDERFAREGSDLVTEQTISFVTACIGGELEVETLNGTKKIDIPAGTQNGEELRLDGEGLPELRSRHKGDLIVRITIEVPKKISKKQAELLKEFEKESKKKILGIF